MGTKNKVLLNPKECDVRVVKVRLDPNKTTRNLLFNYATAANACYNTMLWIAQTLYQVRKWDVERGEQKTEMLPIVPLDKYKMIDFFNAYKNELLPWWEQIPSIVFKTAIMNLADAYDRFLNESLPNQYPKYRKRSQMVESGRLSFTIDLSGEMYPFKANGIKVPVPNARKKREFKLGYKESLYVKIAPDRRLTKMVTLVERECATAQAVTYSYSGGWWWASIQFRVLKPYRRQYVRRTNDYVGGRCGIDVGFGNTFAHLSTPVPGLTSETGRIKAPRLMRKSAKKLARVQRARARCEKGSRKSAILLRKIQKLYHTIAAERARWLSELATTLLGVFDTIVVENLNLKALAKRKRGNKYSFGASISDGGYGMFVELLQRKTARYKSTSVIVAHKYFPSTRLCSRPGCSASKTKMPLSERVYECECCGLVLDRDVNAARNLAVYDPAWEPGRKKHYDRTGCDSNSGSIAGASGTREREEDSFLVPLGARDSQTELAQVEFQQSCRRPEGCSERRGQRNPTLVWQAELDGTTHS